MSTWGTTTPSQTVGRIEQVLANPHGAIWLPAGATIDWANVTAQSGDTTYDDSTPVYDGEKAIVRGTVMVRLATAEVQTVTITGAPTAWDFLLTFSKDDPAGTPGTDYITDGFTVTGTSSAYDNTTALQAFLDGFYGAGRVAVVQTSGTVLTITYSSNLGDVPVAVRSAANFTAGTSPAATVATSTAGAAGAGKWLPYASGTLVNGGTAIVNTTIKQANLQAGLNGQADGVIVGLLVGGTVWKERLVYVGAEPSAANIVTITAALPQLTVVYGDR